MKKALLLLIVSLLTACSTLSPEYSKSPGRILVKGTTENCVATKIRSVNDGDVLFVRGTHLSSKVWLYPGDYHISVSCEAGFPWGTQIGHITVPLTVKMGYRYELQGRYEEEAPLVTIKEIPDPL